MNTKDAIEYAEMCVALARHTNAGAFRVALNVSKLYKCERRAHRLAEMLCNGEIEQDAYDTKRDRVRKNVHKALTELDLRALELEVGGDPRGSCLKINLGGRKLGESLGEFRF